MAICVAALVRGQRVTLTLRGIGEVQGQVVWSAADGIGIAFDRLIDPQHALRPPKAKAPERFIPEVTHSRRPGLRVR
jgi:hypothetical protein